MEDLIRKIELQEAIAKLDDRYLTQKTFQTLLDHIKSEIVNCVRNDLIIGDNKLNIEVVKLTGAVNELKNRLDHQANKGDTTQTELTNIKILLTELATEVAKYNHDTVIVMAESGRQKERLTETENHSKRLEENFETFKNKVSGVSSRGEPATLQERAYDLEITTKDHEYRIIQLEKSSPKNYELAQKIKEQNELLSVYNLLILLLAKVSCFVKVIIVSFFLFINNRRKEIYTAIAQSLLIRVLIFLVSMFVSSPVWVKFIEKFVDLIMK